MKLILSLARIIVGILFIFSGLIKANDPLGLSYKMQEFFEVWGMHALNDYTLAFSILMNAFEIIAGVAVLLGWRMKLFSWLLLLLIIFFTFLTGYALFSGKIRTCGCFGDCIPLTADQSFIKDLVLLGLILLLFAFKSKIKPAFSNGASIALLLLTTIFSFGIQWYTLKHLPFMDCLPYKKGKNIQAQMKIPEGAIPDSTVITFVYKKQGKEVEFTADKFPDDFDDSLYQFVKRYDKVVRKGNAEPPIKDFVLLTENNNDTTQAILQTPGYQLMLFTKGVEALRSDWLEAFKAIHEDARQKKFPLRIITSNYDNISMWSHKAAGLGNETLILKCDYVAIKTAARANPTLYLVKDGSIENKWSYADFNKAVKYLERVK